MWLMNHRRRGVAGSGAAGPGTGVALPLPPWIRTFMMEYLGLAYFADSRMRLTRSCSLGVFANLV